MPQKNRTQPTRNNAAVKHSLERGRAIGDYVGELSAVIPIMDPQTGVTRHQRTKGVPFVRRERAALEE